MNERAVIYCSKHDSTREVAQTIGKRNGLPVINIDHISGFSFMNIPVIFCGWVRAGKIQGLVKAQKLFYCSTVVVCGANPFLEEICLKLKNKNGIRHENLIYVQTGIPERLSILEQFWLKKSDPDLWKEWKKRRVRKTHEFSI